MDLARKLVLGVPNCDRNTASTGPVRSTFLSSTDGLMLADDGAEASGIRRIGLEDLLLTCYRIGD